MIYRHQMIHRHLFMLLPTGTAVFAAISNINMYDNWQGEVHGLSVTAAGDSVFMSGHTSSNKDLSGIMTTSGYDVWVARVPTSGAQRQWLTMLSSSGDDFSYSNNIYNASNNRVFIHGHTNGQLQASNISSDGTIRGFIAELVASNGSLISIQYYGDTGSAVYADSIQIDSLTGYFYLSGTVSGSLNGKSVVGSKRQNLYLASYHRNGTNLWTDVWGSVSQADIMAGHQLVAADGIIYSAGSVYAIAGQAVGSGGYDLFVCRHQQTTGQRVNCALSGNAGDQIAYAMTVNASNGAVYVVGYTNGTFGGPGVSPVYNGQSAFVARLLTANGSMQWLQTWGNSSSRNIAYSVEVSPFNGDLYAGGSSGDAELEGQSLIGAPCDLSLSRLAAGSQRRWTQLSGSIGADIIYSMDIDSFNQVWLGTLNGNSYIQLAYMSDDSVRPTTTITGGASNTGTTSRNGSSSGGGGGGSSSNPGTNLTFGWFNFDGTLILAITGSAILLSLFAAAILTARKLRDKRSAAAAVTTTVNNTKAEEIKPTATVQRPNPLIRSQASIANEISQHNDAMKNMSSSFFGYSVTIQNPLFIGSPKNNG